MKRLDLGGKWKMKQTGSSTWMAAEVPGTVLSSLLKNGCIADPYDRMNEYEAREWLEKDYCFETEFALPDGWEEEPGKTELVFEGLDTIAQIWLNGSLLGTADNMHRIWRWDCSDRLEETNVLRVDFRSPIAWCAEHPATPGKEIDYAACGSMKHTQYIRKAHSMFGWDWGPQLPDMGIWRPVRLERYQVRLGEIRFSQKHGSAGVELSAEQWVEGLCDLPEEWDCEYRLTVSLKDDQGCLIARETKAIRESSEGAPLQTRPAGSALFQMKIEAPHLWWPNGMGAQPLYEVTVQLQDGSGRVLEEQIRRIGLRTLTVSTEQDRWGREFALMVNGVKIFAKGADYIPEDCLYTEIGPERVKRLIETAALSNFNCLRVWGGGYYPSDVFYDLCDTYGLIVWQDFMFACNIYDFEEGFEDNISQEIRENVRRIRHHACLGLWCGNNEMEMAWLTWEDVQRHSNRLKADYIKQFEYVIPKILQEEDPDRFYWPSSPSSGGSFEDPNSEACGDTHYWDVWHGQKPFAAYRTHDSRFCSEFGFQSFPLLKTVRTFTEEKDRNIFSQVMESHQKNDAANGKILYYISETFRYPKGFEELLYVSQILQGIAVKCGTEYWRRNRGRCMGALYWQLNDNWPVASWSSVDYYGRWKVLQYMARKFFAPRTGMIETEHDTVCAAAVNDTLEPAAVKAVIRLKNLRLEVLQESVCEAELPPLSAVSLGQMDVREKIAGRRERVFAEVTFEFSDGSRCVQHEIFVPYKYLDLDQPQITCEIQEEAECFCIRLKTDVYAPFVWIDLAENDVLLSDNCLCLGSGEAAEIRMPKRDMLTGEALAADEVRRQITVKSLYDTYA